MHHGRAMNATPNCAETELRDVRTGIEHMQMLETGLRVLKTSDIGSDLTSATQITE
jgi:hypothetical protein